MKHSATAVSYTHLDVYKRQVYTTVYVPVRLFPEMDEQNFTDASFYEMLDSRGLTVMRTSQRLDCLLYTSRLSHLQTEQGDAVQAEPGRQLRCRQHPVCLSQGQLR